MLFSAAQPTANAAKDDLTVPAHYEPCRAQPGRGAIRVRCVHSNPHPSRELRPNAATVTDAEASPSGSAPTTPCRDRRVAHEPHARNREAHDLVARGREAAAAQPGPRPAPE